MQGDKDCCRGETMRANPSSAAPADAAHRPVSAVTPMAAESSQAGAQRGGCAAALSGASGGAGVAPGATPEGHATDSCTLSAIQRTYTGLSKEACEVLEARIKDGRWPEVKEQVRRSEDARSKQPGAAMSSVLVSCPPTGSTLLLDLIDALLDLLVDFQVTNDFHLKVDLLL